MTPASNARGAATCAVIVNWNGWQDTICCLESLLAQDVPLRVVVCDNGSSDDSLRHIGQWLRRRLDGWAWSAGTDADVWGHSNSPVAQGIEAICLRPLANNRGYAGGLNAGIRWAQAQWGADRFWLLNNDLEARSDALRALQEAHAAVPSAGICGSVLMEWDRPDNVQAVAGVYRRWLGVGGHLREARAGHVQVGVDYPVGASLYVVQDYLDRVGFMDESYFLYGEEMDWAERGRRNGFVAVAALASRLKHKEGASTGSRGGVRHKSLLSERYGVVNRLRLTRRFWPYWLPLVWLSLIAVAADRVLHGEFARAALVLKLMFGGNAWWRDTPSARPDILYCHLNDDTSGSPRVLVHSISALARRFPRSATFVSSSQFGGFLGRSNVLLRRYSFRKSLRHPWLALSFLAGQLQLFVQMVLSAPQRGAPVYVNTCLPFAGAVFGVLTRRPVVFHSHEIPQSAFEKLVFAITVRCSTVVICVSHTHASRLSVPRARTSRVIVVPNALDPEFARHAAGVRKTHRCRGSFRVLYVTSAVSAHKGIAEFQLLAGALACRSDIQLVLAIPQQEAAALPTALPASVTVECGSDLPQLYAEADLLLNLSRPDLGVETFGLTIVEAMAFGTPAVVPPVGGPAELVRDGEEGFQVDPRDTRGLANAVSQLADDGALWARFSEAARRRAGDFSFAAYERALAAAVDTAIAARPTRWMPPSRIS